MVLRLSVLLTVLVLAVTPALAADFTESGLTGSVQQEPSGRDVYCLTQNVDPNYLEAGTGVACGSGFGTTDNFYLRRFHLTDDHGINLPFTVMDVTFGIETSDLAWPIEVRIYSIPTGSPLLLANLTLLWVSNATAPPGDLYFVGPVPVGGTIDPSADDLVVEMFNPNGQDDFQFLYPGCNPLGETQPTYLYAPDCGLTEPTPTGQIGFPDAQWVLTVCGEDEVVATEDRAWTGVKSLYR